MTKPLVSFIVPSWNRLSVLLDTINKINEFTKVTHEILVIDDNSTEDYSVVQTLPNVRYFKNCTNKERWECANIGFRHSVGEYIVSLDDDSFPGENCIELSIQLLNESSIGLVAMEVYDYDDYYNNLVKIKPTGLVDRHTFIACGAVFRRSLLVEIGMWENLPIYPVEVSFSLRIINRGYHIVQRPDIYVIHRLCPVSRPTYRRFIECSNTSFRLYGTYNNKLKYLVEGLHHLILTDLLRGNLEGIKQFWKFIMEGKPKPYKLKPCTISKLKFDLRLLGKEIKSESSIKGDNLNILLFRTAEVQNLNKCIEHIKQKLNNPHITVLSHITQTNISYDDVIWYNLKAHFRFKLFSKSKRNQLKKYDIFMFMGFNYKYLGGYENLQYIAHRFKKPLYSISQTGVIVEYTKKDFIIIQLTQIISYIIMIVLIGIKTLVHSFKHRKEYYYDEIN